MALYNETMCMYSQFGSVPFKGKAMKVFVTALVTIALFNSCNSNHDAAKALSNNKTEKPSTQPSIRETVLTSAEQKSLTPIAVMNDLEEGNKHYAQNHLTGKRLHRDVAQLGARSIS
jgi:hypothetical protein